MGRTFALAIAIALTLGTARADDNTTYLYGAYGYIKTVPGIDKDAADAQLLANGATGLTSTVKHTDSGFKVQFGWMPNRYFGIEAGFVALGTATYSADYTDAALNMGNTRTEFRAGGGVVDFLGIAPVGGGFSLFGKAGVIGAAVVTTTTTTTTTPLGVVTTSQTASNARMFRPNYGVGAMFDFAQNWAVRVEIERYANLGADNTGKSNVDMISLGLLLKL